MRPAGSAVVAGHVCLDVILDAGRLSADDLHRALQPGRLVEVGPAVISTGGPVSNTGLALHLLGVPTRLVCKVGRDRFGGLVRDLISARDPSLAAGIVETPDASTSYSVVISPPGVDRIFLHHPGANDSFDAGDVDFHLVESAALFHFGYPPAMRRMYENDGEQLIELLRRAKATGATTSLDMSYPDPASPGGRVAWRPILESALPFVDVFLPSFEELLLLLHPDRVGDEPGGIATAIAADLVHDLGEELIGMGVRMAVIKLGEQGAYLRTASEQALGGAGRGGPLDPREWADRELWAPCFRVEVVGTNGSGDTTIAGFHAALLRGLGPEAALTMAVAVGACSVESPDALGSLRSWEETRARIDAGWAQRPLDLDGTSRSRTGEDGLWERR